MSKAASTWMELEERKMKREKGRERRRQPNRELGAVLAGPSFAHSLAGDKRAEQVSPPADCQNSVHPIERSIAESALWNWLCWRAEAGEVLENRGRNEWLTMR